MTTIDQSELAQTLFEELGDALFLLDPETDRLLEVNPMVLRLTGFTQSEVLAFPATHWFRYEATGGLQRLRGAFTNTMPFHGQDGFLLRTKDNAWIPVNLTVSRLHLSPKTLGLIIARDDRDRRQAFAQARRIESELRQVLGNSPAALWSAERAAGPDVMASWQFRYVSPLLSRLGGRPSEFFNHPFKWAEVVHPQERPGYQHWVRQLLQNGINESELVYRITHPNGAVRWVRDRLQVVRDATGRPTRIDGCVVDITEHRQAEEALRQSEQRFRALVEKSRDGVLLLDDRGVIRYATPAIRTTLGYDPEAVVGRDAFEFLHPDDVSDSRTKLALVMERPGEGLLHTWRWVTADGTIRLIEGTGCNRLDDPSVRSIVVNYRDITDRAAAAQELAQQHALLEGLFASVPDVICYKDRNMKFLGGNPAFEELAGRPIADVLGKGCDELFTGEWADRFRAAEWEVLRTGKTLRSVEMIGYPDGREVPMDAVITPLQGEGKEPAGLIVTCRDMTEQMRMEEQLRQAHKLEAVGRLAGGIAHDFNNLLTIILGNLELVRTGAAGVDTDELLASTERAATQAADLTKQMLGFARRQPLRTTTFDLSGLVNEVATLLRRTIDPRVVLNVVTAADLRPVAADPVQVQQILMNLCLNARDAMPEGGTLTVETANADEARPPSAKPDDPTTPFVRVSVSDTGIGMTEEVRRKIFEPFFTTKGVGQGTGLGLAVVYGVAQAHGGWVDCISSPGAGSRFDVYLPRGVLSDEQVTRPSDTPAVRGGGETVLVADDEPAVRSLAQLTLERKGYRVLLASTGTEAVEVFRRNAKSNNIALVVLDVSMPEMSGTQACAAIREHDATIPVLFASGHPLSDTATELGAGFLQKPYTPSTLTVAVRETLDNISASPR